MPAGHEFPDYQPQPARPQGIWDDPTVEIKLSDMTPTEGTWDDPTILLAGVHAEGAAAEAPAQATVEEEREAWTQAAVDQALGHLSFDLGNIPGSDEVLGRMGEDGFIAFGFGSSSHDELEREQRIAARQAKLAAIYDNAEYARPTLPKANWRLFEERLLGSSRRPAGVMHEKPDGVSFAHSKGHYMVAGNRFNLVGEGRPASQPQPPDQPRFKEAPPQALSDTPPVPAEVSTLEKRLRFSFIKEVLRFAVDLPEEERVPTIERMLRMDPAPIASQAVDVPAVEMVVVEIDGKEHTLGTHEPHQVEEYQSGLVGEPTERFVRPQAQSGLPKISYDSTEGKSSWHWLTKYFGGRARTRNR